MAVYKPITIPEITDPKKSKNQETIDLKKRSLPFDLCSSTDEKSSTNEREYLQKKNERYAAKKWQAGVPFTSPPLDENQEDIGDGAEYVNNMPKAHPFLTKIAKV